MFCLEPSRACACYPAGQARYCIHYHNCVATVHGNRMFSYISDKPGLTTSLQTWTTLMLLITQQLIILRDLGTRRTLTSTHDSDMAWSGLGRSLLTLWRQIEIPAHVGGTLTAVVYLTAIAVLHISTPSLFIFEAFNQTISIPVNTTGGTDWANPDTQTFEYDLHTTLTC